MREFPSEEEQEQYNELVTIQGLNSDVLSDYAQYLIKHSTFITKKLVEEICTGFKLTAKEAYFQLFSAACGRNIEENDKDRKVAYEYIEPSIKRLDPIYYENNPYYRKIHFDEQTVGKWQLKHERYEPYEAFIWNDLSVDTSFREIPNLGFFEQAFTFPAVLEQGKEWMTITPNEIETMQPVIDKIEGKVITFGLGLGYFAYMASEKKTVEKVTILEQDKEVIELFTTYILPQFAHKEKIHIIQEDAFSYVKEQMNTEQFDHAFVDLWHDASDGVDLYLKMRKLEQYANGTQFDYWIETTLLSGIRFYVSNAIFGFESEGKRQEQVNRIMKQMSTTTIEQIKACLGDEFIKKLALVIK